MITKVRIKNFKCFGPRGTDFDLNKVNFVFGDNSSGKSTLLQFLDEVVKIGSTDADNRLHVGEIDRFVYEGREPNVHGLPIENLCSEGIEGDLSQFEKKIEESWIEHGFGSARRYISGVIRCVGDSEEPSEPTEMLLCPAKGWYLLWRGRCLGDPTKLEPVSKGDLDRFGVRVSHVEAGAEASGYSVRRMSIDELNDLKPIPYRSKEEEQDELQRIKLATDPVIEHIDDFLSRIGLEYECVRWCDGVSFDSIRIRDKILDVECELKSVGTGVQRLFNLAKKLARWKDGVLALEEPESNVNERQMAGLTRALVDEALKRPRGQLIVECHSKLVALQLAALVRQGVLKTGDGPDANLSVMEVVKTPRGSEVRPIGISTSGDIDWPGGFFPSEGDILRRMYGG